MRKGNQLTSAGYATRAVHAGTCPDSTTGAIVEPIAQCSVFAQPHPGEFRYDYGRSMNPNYYALEETLAALEFAEHAAVFSSGVAAMTAISSVLSSGDQVIIPTDLYKGSYRLFKQIFEKFGVTYTQVNLLDLNRVEDSLKALRPKMLYIESPTNPLLTVADLRELALLARHYGALSVVDNTFASPYFQNPLKLGIDVVLHSCSKYIGGHSDIVGGALMTNDKDYRDKMDYVRKSMGLHADPFTMFLMRRGIKTLPLRMEASQKNAFAVARFLESHPLVERVVYPGLSSHPQHDVAKGQMSGFSGMVSVYFRLSVDEAKELISSFNIITLAESLGGVESLVEQPATMTHSEIPREVREKHGLSDGLIRFSFGIEDEQDLIADISHALERCPAAARGCRQS